MTSSDSTNRRHAWRWIAGAVGVLVVLAIAVPFAYIHLIQGPAPKQLALPAADKTPNSTRTGAGSSASAGASAGGSTGTASGKADGTWKVASGSQAGYRVKETLAGQPNTAVGRTSQVTGSFVLAGSTVTKGSFTVDLRTVTSDESQRDDQFNGRIMDTADHPYATFTLTKPIALGTTPKTGKVISAKAIGTLAMHGVTHTATASLQVRFTGSAFQISGTIPVTFADWDIANPGFGGFVTTQNHGTVEFLILTSRG